MGSRLSTLVGRVRLTPKQVGYGRLCRDGSRLVGRGFSVSRSHMSFYLRTGGGGGVGVGGGHLCRSTFIRVDISRLLILQSLH